MMKPRLFFLILLILEVNLCASVLPLTELLKSDKVWIDPPMQELEFRVEGELPEARLRLAYLSQSTPVRIEVFRDYIRVLRPTFLRTKEEIRYRATIMCQKQENILTKLARMDGWFLRMKVEHKIVGETIHIQLEGFPEFYLNQFYAEFEKLRNYLFSTKPFHLQTSTKDWILLQRDLIVEGHRNEHPDHYSVRFEPKFSIHRRVGAGSDLYAPR